MAESDKIDFRQLIDDRKLVEMGENAQVASEKMSLLIDALKKLNAENGKTLKEKKGTTASDLKEELALIEKTKRERIALIAVQKEEAKAQEAINREKLKTAQATDKATASQKAQSDAYGKTAKELANISREIKNLIVSGKEIPAALTQRFNELDSNVRKADQSVGQFGRSVGDYKGKFNGLGNSINQLTREMPAFANSMQTGFMAISNNLPIFFDEIKRTNDELKLMKAEGKAVPSLFSSIASSIFTWGTALSIGVTLLTVFGKQLVELVGELFKTGEAFKYSEDLVKENHTFLSNVISEYRSAVIDLRESRGEISKETANILRGEQDKSEKLLQLQAITNKKRVELAKQFNIDVSKVQEVAKPNQLQMVSGTQTEETTRAIIQGQKELNAGIEKINKEHSDAVILLNATTNKKVEVQNTEKAKKEKEHKDKLTDQDRRVLDEMQILEEKRIKDQENLRKWQDESDKNRAKEEETVWWDKENGITLEYHNFLIQRRLNDEELERQRKNKITIEYINETQRILQFTQQALDAENNLRQQALDTQISNREKAINRQFELAKEGLTNQYAWEQEQQAKDQLKKKDLLKREAREREAIQLSQAYLNAYNAELTKPGANPTTAAANALKDVLIAKAIGSGIAALASYFDGTEDTGNGGKIDNKGGFISVLHPNERVMTAEQNKKIGKAKLSNEKLTDIAVKYNAGQLVDIAPKYNLSEGKNTAENIFNSIQMQQYSEMTNLLKKIADKPILQSDFREVHGRLDLIETEYRNGSIKVVETRGKARL